MSMKRFPRAAEDCCEPIFGDTTGRSRIFGLLLLLLLAIVGLFIPKQPLLAQQAQPLFKPAEVIRRELQRDYEARERWRRGEFQPETDGAGAPATAIDGSIAWHWSQPSSHHAAVCRVRSNTHDGQGYPSGSGVLVSLNGCTGVLTAAHVVRGGRTATATFPNGTSVSGRNTHDKFGHDVAWIQVTSPPAGITPLPIAAPQIGQVELCGWGGPSQKLRHYWAQLDFQDSRSIAVSRVTSTYGDSGGPWVQNGKVVGINSTVGMSDGSNARHVRGPNGNSWVIGDMAHSPPGTALTAFCSRVVNSGFG
jgi:hypothetical protein